jgi:hypothetical protein
MPTDVMINKGEKHKSKYSCIGFLLQCITLKVISFIDFVNHGVLFLLLFKMPDSGQVHECNDLEANVKHKDMWYAVSSTV